LQTSHCSLIEVWTLSSVEATTAGTTTAVRKTALNAVHRQMGAKMVDFNGWDMPVEYPASIGGGIINEHLAVRTGVGIFDVSHMGDIRRCSTSP
jgi:aminomethyltransferase